MRRMSWQWRAAVVCLAVLSACAGGPKLTDDGRRVQGVAEFVAELGHAYERRDASAVMAGIAPSFADREALRRDVEAAAAGFDEIELPLTIERIHLDADTATVYLRWDGQWRAAGREPIVRQGAARFIVDTRERSLLTAVIGDTPFAPVGATPAGSP
ncbi:MAG: hypothetical protein ACOYXU_07170 [Nitrospirota bacterium]